MAFFEEDNHKSYVRGLIGGGEKVGKTRLVIELSKSKIYGPICIIDMEDGTKYDKNLLAKGSQIVHAKNNIELASIIHKMTKAGDSLPFRTVVIDPITASWKKIVAAYVKIKAKKKKIIDAKYGNGSKAIKDEVDAYESMQNFNVNDWGEVKKLSNKIIMPIFDLPVHVFMITWITKDFDKNNKVIGTKPVAEKSLKYLTDFFVTLDITDKGKRVFAKHLDRTKIFSKIRPAQPRVLEEVAESIGIMSEDEKPKAKKDISLKVTADDTMPCEECGAPTKISILEKTYELSGDKVCWECNRKMRLEDK